MQTLLWSLLLYCWRWPQAVSDVMRTGPCIAPPSNRSSIEEMCSSPYQHQHHPGGGSQTEWHLYSVDYEPFMANGIQRDSFFRIGGIDWRCMDLVVRCVNRTRLQLTQRCRNVTAVYMVDQVTNPDTELSYQDGGRCCTTKLQLRPGFRVHHQAVGSCALYAQNDYELWGHASQLLLVQVCQSVLHIRGHVRGHWLFVAQNGDVAEIKRALAALIQHYPYLRVHRWTTTLANKDACGCATFDKYLVQLMNCNAPMYDRASFGQPRMDMALRPVSTKTIHMVIPTVVFRVLQGVILLNGLLWICTFAVRHQVVYEL